jgi:cation diffusion facilitator CzcD-associated flavoprotein CzcO
MTTTERPTRADGPHLRTHSRIVIIGTGFSGLGVAIRLLAQGRTDFVILERADSPGGTWRENTYPGLRCDVPSHLYSLSFAPNPGWSRLYPAQAELRAYFERLVDDYDLRRFIRFGCEMERADWDEQQLVWRLTTSSGEITADLLVAGTGILAEATDPDIKGLDTFGGARFHSSRWDHDHDLRGKRVAVIGTGCSAIQFVPEIQPIVGHLDVYQRTPNWILPHPDRQLSAAVRFAFRHLPGACKAFRAGLFWLHELGSLAFVRDTRLTVVPEALAKRHLRKQVADPRLRAELLPSYTFGCKRVTYSDTWYPALQAPNVELVTDSIQEVTETGIVTADGTEREVDTLILATGYRFAYRERLCPRVFGRDGQRLLDAAPVAYRGTMVAGYPNLFVMIGPNVGLGHNSMVEIIEGQIRFFLNAVEHLETTGMDSLEVTESAQDTFNDRIQDKLAHTVWNTGGCSSWYLDEHGKNRAQFPGSAHQLRKTLGHFDPNAFITVNRAAEISRPAGVRATGLRSAA